MPNWIVWSYLPNPSARTGYDTRSIFKRSLTGFNSEFSFSKTTCLNKAEKPSLPYYLPIAGGRIIGFIPFPRVLVLCEMQSVRSRIWTRIAVSIYYNNNHYTTGTSQTELFDIELYICIKSWRWPWCNSYRHRKWTRRHVFKSWMRLILFHIALIPLGKVWIQLFSLQLWVNSRTDWVLQPWWGN